MLTSLTLRNFRSLRSISLEQVGRITLIAGKNGVGKTALLEALWLLSGPDLPELGSRVNTLRGLPLLGPEDIFKDLFRNYDAMNPIRISARGDWSNRPRTLDINLQERSEIDSAPTGDLGGAGASSVERTTRPQLEGNRELVFSYKHNDGRRYVSKAWWIADQLVPVDGPPAPALTGEGIRQQRQPVNGRPDSIFATASYRDNPQTIASRFGAFQIRGDETKLVELLSVMEPRLQRLALIQVRNTPLIHAYLHGISRPIPVHLLGEGLNRILHVALSMGGAIGGLLLVDEIENGLHHTVQEELFAALLTFSNIFDVQIFATTHSEECVIAAHKALKDREKEFSFYRLEQFDGSVRAVHFDQETLGSTIKFNMEFR